MDRDERLRAAIIAVAHAQEELVTVSAQKRRLMSRVESLEADVQSMRQRLQQECFVTTKLTQDLKIAHADAEELTAFARNLLTSARYQVAASHLIAEAPSVSPEGLRLVCDQLNSLDELVQHQSQGVPAHSERAFLQHCKFHVGTLKQLLGGIPFAVTPTPVTVTRSFDIPPRSSPISQSITSSFASLPLQSLQSNTDSDIFPRPALHASPAPAFSDLNSISTPQPLFASSFNPKSVSESMRHQTPNVCHSCGRASASEVKQSVVKSLKSNSKSVSSKKSKQISALKALQPAAHVPPAASLQDELLQSLVSLIQTPECRQLILNSQPTPSLPAMSARSPVEPAFDASTSTPSSHRSVASSSPPSTVGPARPLDSILREAPLMPERFSISAFEQSPWLLDSRQRSVDTTNQSPFRTHSIDLPTPVQIASAPPLPPRQPTMSTFKSPERKNLFAAPDATPSPFSESFIATMNGPPKVSVQNSTPLDLNPDSTAASAVRRGATGSSDKFSAKMKWIQQSLEEDARLLRTLSALATATKASASNEN